MITRKYVLMTATKTDLKHPLFWGTRSLIENQRMFSGYTPNVEDAELYSLSDIFDHFFDKNEYPELPADTSTVRLYEFNPKDWGKFGEGPGVFITPLEVVENQTERVFHW